MGRAGSGWAGEPWAGQGGVELGSGSWEGLEPGNSTRRLCLKGAHRSETDHRPPPTGKPSAQKGAEAAWVPLTSPSRTRGEASLLPAEGVTSEQRAPFRVIHGGGARRGLAAGSSTSLSGSADRQTDSPGGSTQAQMEMGSPETGLVPTVALVGKEDR